LNNKAYENAFLIRHAKSDWPINVTDFDRPLNERGKKNAPKMANFLKNLGVRIDNFVTSPAKELLQRVNILLSF
jgi:phosphohistidine phosphatase